MKKNKLTAIVISFVLLLTAFAGGLHYTQNSSETSENAQFIDDLTAIYKTYDSDLSNINSDTEFALKRLIVSDYSGDDCGAVAKAVDKKNNFAVLQFETEQQAKSAYDTLTSKGVTVDADGVAQIQAFDKCEMHPAGSEAVGTTSFINHCAMDTDDILVAVIDTGMMLSHPELTDRFVNEGYDYSSDALDNADYDAELQPNYYHGTAVCGIIANNTMDNVKILPYKIVPFGSTTTTDSAAISAMNNAVDMGVDVINLSLSSTTAGSSYRRAIQNAYRNNVCVCVSAGNSSKSCDALYPACISESFTVSALNTKMTGRASYSNYGQSIDFCAPGTKINSATPMEKGEGGYDIFSGTSFSTPYITALCSDIKSVNSGLTNDQVYDILCDFSADYGDSGFDEYYGNGMPSIGNIKYAQADQYDYSIPQGVLNVYDNIECSADNKPWNAFAPQIKQVNIIGTGRIHAYSFSDMKKASFSFDTPITYIGEAAFRNCENLNEISFDENIDFIGEGAFDGIDDLTIHGYMNTPAYEYALANDITFNSLGCKHAYIIDVVEPSGSSAGYTRYECRICGDSYIGEYIATEVIDSGMCGDNLRYELNSIGKLTISGIGDMYDYSSARSPWYPYAESISIIQIDKEISSVSPFAFYGCANLIEFKNSSSAFTTINKSLYNAEGTKLICAVNGYGSIYTMPDTVEELDATAFLAVKIVNVVTNDRFTIDSSIIYDSKGNIALALPGYSNALLSIENDIDVHDYAFILTEYPNIVRVYSTRTNFGVYSIGYHYDNGFVKNDLEYYGYVDAPAYRYAVENEFKTNSLNAGSCGENLSWHYNVEDKKLTVSGHGDMTSYTTQSLIPWYDYMGDIEEVVIDDEVAKLSPYAFYNAKNLKTLTLPASIGVPESNSVWGGVNSIETINITCGTGIIPNYGTSYSSRIYTYSPWYISRESIENFNLSPELTSIGSFAFRGCSCITSVTLNNCWVVSKYAFFDCTGLERLTVLSKDTSFASASVFAYSSLDLKNEDAVLYAYSDSTAADFAVKNGLTFASLGCGHSRGINAQSDHPVCCYDATVSYYCKDCKNSLYSEYLRAESDGHFVRAMLTNTKGKAIPDAEVYLDGVLSAKTNSSGKFVIDCVKCEIEHTVVLKKHGYVIAETTVNTNKSNRTGNLSIQYGNFIPDTAVNGKDYVYAKKTGFDDLDLMVLGKIKGEKLAIKSAFSNQTIPSVNNMYVEQNPQISYRKDFCFDTVYTSYYDITEVGILYGKNMSEDFMLVENIDKKNPQGYQLKKAPYPDFTKTYTVTYGLSAQDGVASARLYFKYTNGVKNYIYYSDVLNYEY